MSMFLSLAKWNYVSVNDEITPKGKWNFVWFLEGKIRSDETDNFMDA